MAAVHHLGFVGESGGTTHEGPLMVAIPCKNFNIIDIALLKLKVFEFMSFTLESPTVLVGRKVHFGGLTPKL